jgi:hypothetical protein
MWQIRYFVLSRILKKSKIANKAENKDFFKNLRATKQSPSWEHIESSGRQAESLFQFLADCRQK